MTSCVRWPAVSNGQLLFENNHHSSGQEENEFFFQVMTDHDLHHTLDLLGDALVLTDHLRWHGGEDVVGFVVVRAEQAAVEIVDDATDGRIGRVRHGRRGRRSAAAPARLAVDQRSRIDSVIGAHCAGHYGRRMSGLLATDGRHGRSFHYFTGERVLQPSVPSSFSRSNEDNKLSIVSVV